VQSSRLAAEGSVLFFQPGGGADLPLAAVVLLLPWQAREVVMTVVTSTGTVTLMGTETLKGTVTVNAAFMQEIKEVNQELWALLGELRHRCLRPIAPAHGRHLIDKMCQLRDQLALHFSLEEAYGYFEDPVDVAPQLSRQAERLRAEHKEIYTELCDLMERAERMFYDEQHAELALWIGPEFLAFDERLRQHEDQEIELITEAYSGDIGVGD
jgi:hypothetical protein